MADCPSFSNTRQTVMGIRSKSKDEICQVFALAFDFSLPPLEQAEERVIYVGLSVRMSERIMLFDS